MFQELVPLALIEIISVLKQWFDHLLYFAYTSTIINLVHVVRKNSLTCLSYRKEKDKNERLRWTCNLELYVRLISMQVAHPPYSNENVDSTKCNLHVH